MHIAGQQGVIDWPAWPRKQAVTLDRRSKEEREPQVIRTFNPHTLTTVPTFDSFKEIWFRSGRGHLVHHIGHFRRHCHSRSTSLYLVGAIRISILSNTICLHICSDHIAFWSRSGLITHTPPRRHNPSLSARPSAADHPAYLVRELRHWLLALSKFISSSSLHINTRKNHVSSKIKTSWPVSPIRQLSPALVSTIVSISTTFRLPGTGFPSLGSRSQLL